MSAEDLGAGSSGRLGQEFRTNAIVGNHYRIIKRLGSGETGSFVMITPSHLDQTFVFIFRLIRRHLHGRKPGE